ncbi:MAG: hypothetical protein FWF22_07320, partial [Treponema sp.]|nr:hypothetical protein [Treponema sp.]
MPDSRSFRTEEHIKFWNRRINAAPLASFRTGSYFVAANYKAAGKLLIKGRRISAEMIDVDSFLEDYEQQYREINSLDQGGFWTAEPFTGIPWMEAFWGCEIYGNGESFTARPFIKNPADLSNLSFSSENPWVKKYFEFVIKLNEISAGRFPVGAPIMRGQGDTLGAIMGQTEFIYALYEEPAIMKAALGKITDSFLFINSEMNRLNKPFLG